MMIMRFLISTQKKRRRSLLKECFGSQLLTRNLNSSNKCSTLGQLSEVREPLSVTSLTNSEAGQECRVAGAQQVPTKECNNVSFNRSPCSAIHSRAVLGYRARYG